MKENWTYKRFGEVFNLQMGKTPSRDNFSYWGGDNIWVSIADLKDKYIDSTKEHITDLAVSESGIHKVPQGTAIMSFKLTIGRAAITKCDLYTNEAIMSFEPKETDTILADYVYYYLKGCKWMGANKAVMGQTLNKRTIIENVFAYPPLATQSRIVSELDLLQSIIDKQKTQLKEYDTLAQSIFYDMFGDNNCTKIKLEEVVRVQSGLVSPLEAPYCDMIHIGPANIESYTGKLVNLKTAKEEKLISGKYLFDPSMVLYSKIRPNLNKVTIAPFEGICSADMYPLKPTKELDKSFLLFILKQKDFLDYAISNSGRANIPKINREALLNYKIILPPLSLQQFFAAKIESIEKQKAAISKSIAETQKLFDYTMDKYFG